MKTWDPQRQTNESLKSWKVEVARGPSTCPPHLPTSRRMLWLHLRPVCCVVCVTPARGWFFSSALHEPRRHAWCLCHVPGPGTTWEQVPVLVRVSSPEPAPGARRWGGLGVSRQSLDGPGGAVLSCADGGGLPLPCSMGNTSSSTARTAFAWRAGAASSASPRHAGRSPGWSVRRTAPMRSRRWTPPTPAATSPPAVRPPLAGCAVARL